MPTPSSEQIEKTLVSVNTLVRRLAQALGVHPGNRELQKKFAKLVSDRDKLERYQTPATGSASLPAG